MRPDLEQTVRPAGPFDLLHQNGFFHGWPLLPDGATIVMAFAVEGWQSAAAVTLRQGEDGSVGVGVYGAGADAGRARDQALAALSLDEDGGGWEDAGRRDPALRELQERYRHLRPSLFHSPYEAACSFLIGHRLRIAQTRAIRHRLAEELGRSFTISGARFASFPGPRKLLETAAPVGVADAKVARVHAAAQAALDGWLIRAALRDMDDDDAVARLEALPGVGPFFAQGILHRGAGGADGFTHDDLTYRAIGIRYGLGDAPTRDQVLEIAERWRPYRMWAVVLHHVWLRQRGAPHTGTRPQGPGPTPSIRL